jgi:hypothetical protein
MAHRWPAKPAFIWLSHCRTASPPLARNEFVHSLQSQAGFVTPSQNVRRLSTRTSELGARRPDQGHDTENEGEGRHQDRARPLARPRPPQPSGRAPRPQAVSRTGGHNAVHLSMRDTAIPILLAGLLRSPGPSRRSLHASICDHIERGGCAGTGLTGRAGRRRLSSPHATSRSNDH